MNGVIDMWPARTDVATQIDSGEGGYPGRRAREARFNSNASVANSAAFWHRGHFAAGCFEDAALVTCGGMESQRFVISKVCQ